MARIVVVGGGVAGLAASARLAKLGHDVVLLERSARLGGAIGTLDSAGFRWETGPTSTALPAVVRDLFRKSGRPLERHLELTMRPLARRHVFADGEVVDLPTGSRGAQTRAVDAGLGVGAGAAWTAFVDAQRDVWQRLREQVLDDPNGGARLADRAVGRSLGGSGSLERLLRRQLPDERLRAMVSAPHVLWGSTPKNVPAFAAVDPYVERSFGLWEPAGGMSALADALAGRLGERGVDVRLETPVARLVWDDRRAAVVGAESESGESFDADVVVAAIDPRRVLTDLLPAAAAPAARRAYQAATPATPPAVVHLGLTGDLPALPPEVFLHGPSLLALYTRAQAPPGGQAWTVYHRGSATDDVVIAMARRGIDVRDRVVTRIDRSPADIVETVGGSPVGLAWDGYRAHARRAAFTAPARGLQLIGASVHPGAGVPSAAWGAAHAAARIGPASDR
jgi:phytoene dehydrogenase-like protein